MQFTFSDRISGVQASAVREILKAASDPDVISFGGGNPAAEAFPVAEIKKISDDILTNQPIAALQYGITEGYTPLRESAKAFFNRNEAISKEYDDIIITSGSQQIMDFAAKVLCNEGDVVVSENPSFLGALNSFKSNGARLVGVDVKEDGIDLGQLEEILKTEPVKLIYVIPNFQNPMGTTMSFEKRKGLYALAKKYQVVILEDNPYGDLRFTGDPVPSIKSLDDEGIVLYAASLSKIISPGMRIAACIGHKDLLQKMTIAKQCNDVNSNCWAQMVIDTYLRTTDMEAHLKRISAIYKEQAELMLSEIDKHFHPAIKHTIPEGGMFIWCTLPEGIDTMEFIQDAVAHKVMVVPGSAFLCYDGIKCQSFRMNYSAPSKENIVKGVEILGELTYKYCK